MTTFIFNGSSISPISPILPGTMGFDEDQVAYLQPPKEASLSLNTVSKKETGKYTQHLWSLKDWATVVPLLTHFYKVSGSTMNTRTLYLFSNLTVPDHEKIYALSKWSQETETEFCYLVCAYDDGQWKLFRTGSAGSRPFGLIFELNDPVYENIDPEEPPEAFIVGVIIYPKSGLQASGYHYFQYQKWGMIPARQALSRYLDLIEYINATEGHNPNSLASEFLQTNATWYFLPDRPTKSLPIDYVLGTTDDFCMQLTDKTQVYSVTTSMLLTHPMKTLIKPHEVLFSTNLGVVKGQMSGDLGNSISPVLLCLET